MSNNSTILIVDDQPSAREVLKGLLIGQGYNLIFAGDGPEALAKAVETSPDIVLLDVMMPEMDGFAVCRRLRTDPVLAQVPVIMITALDDHDSIMQGLEAGADDFVTKPFNHAELKARVQNIARLNRYRRLLAEQTKFEWVVEKAGDGYLIVDDDDTILYANSQARLYLGLPAEKNKPITELFLETARRQYNFQPEAAWITWPKHSAPGNDPPSLRYLVRPESATSHAFWLQVEILELPAASQEGKFIRLFDVTAQMNMQRDMWEFQSLVSHKLRTPLGGVVTGLQLLADEYDIKELLTDEMRGLFDLVSDSAQNLKRDILNILHHISTIRSALPGARFDLSQVKPLITQICTDLELNAVTVNNKISLNKGYVALSEQSIELILREILDNSKKFHPQQAPTIEISLSPTDEGNINLQIGDDGVTLPPETLNRLWTPYYQAGKFFTGQIKGMGLGLSRVASLVWSVGGAVRLSSRETGPGVVVSLTLPAIEEKGIP